MTIRTILVPVSGVGGASEQLATAFLVGGMLEAHMDVFHVSLDPRESVAYVGEGMTSGMIEDVMTAAEREAEARAARARESFDAKCKDGAVPVVDTPQGAGFTTSFSTATGREYDLVAARGRLADLIAVARPSKDNDATTQATLEVALMETGRPVLVTPPAAPSRLASTVVIAWNGSHQAALAIGGALPLLRGAATITVLAVTEGSSVVSSQDLVNYFAWHGLAAEGKDIEVSATTIGATLLEQARQAGADLLVMGAYTHSRLRQLIFGGVTRAVLEGAEIPVFMAH